MLNLLKVTPLLLAGLLISSTSHGSITTDNTSLPPELPSIQTRTLSAPLMEKRPIFIYAFVHDDVTLPQSQIFHEHFLPLIKELESVTGRRVSVQFLSNLPSYTDFAYKDDDNKTAYQNWLTRAIHYRNEHNLPDKRTTKFILLTQQALNEKTAGLAGNGQEAAIASLKSKINVGHEIGHTLTAAHENYEVFYRGGWWCESYMTSSPNSLYSNCNTYTDANREKLRAYLNNVP